MKRAILALTLNHDAVRQLNAQPCRCCSALSVRVGRLHLVAAQCPCDGVEHARLALGVFAADDCEPVLGWF